MNNEKIARELVAVARELIAAKQIQRQAARWNERMLKEGLVIVLPNGFEVYVGKRIRDEHGPAIKVTDERGKKYVKDIDNFLTWLRTTRAKPKVAHVARDLTAAGSGDVEWRLIDLREAEEELGKSLRIVTDDVAYSFYAHPSKKDMAADPDRAMKVVETRLRKIQSAVKLINQIRRLVKK